MHLNSPSVFCLRGFGFGNVSSKEALVAFRVFPRGALDHSLRTFFSSAVHLQHLERLVLSLRKLFDVEEEEPQIHALYVDCLRNSPHFEHGFHDASHTMDYSSKNGLVRPVPSKMEQRELRVLFKVEEDVRRHFYFKSSSRIRCRRPRHTSS